ncbi:hypothetical protein I4U23_008661 [Adineta vaga]|nr:hypothetical protein I4U23_008661 [Adineta vaga]
MSSKISLSSSTSTADLHQRHILYSDSSSQTISIIDDNDENDNYANYEEICLQKSFTTVHENTYKKSDQTTLCRTNRYSVACWTKPACLLSN